MRAWALIIMAVGLGLLAAGCTEGPNETSHPLFVKYRKARQDQQYFEASEFLKKYLKVRPDSGEAHLALASLYDENLNDPLGAIYHYRSFLECEPRSPRRRDAEKWLAAAEVKFYRQAKGKYNDPEVVAALQDEVYETRRTLSSAQSENRRMLKLSNDLKSELEKVRKELEEKTVAATDNSILKEQLQKRTEELRRLEAARNTLSEEDKSKEKRLAELREAIRYQEQTVNVLREKLTAAEKTNQQIPLLQAQLDQVRRELQSAQQQLRVIQAAVAPPAMKEEK